MNKTFYLMKAKVYVVADELPDEDSLMELLLNWAREQNLKVIDCNKFRLIPLFNEDDISGFFSGKVEHKEISPYKEEVLLSHSLNFN